MVDGIGDGCPMGKEAEANHADGVLARIQTRYGEKANLLVYENGHLIEAEDTADAWRTLNSFMLTGSVMEGYRLGNRHIVPKITLQIKNWGKSRHTKPRVISKDFEWDKVSPVLNL